MYFIMSRVGMHYVLHYEWCRDACTCMYFIMSGVGMHVCTSL